MNLKLIYAGQLAIAAGGAEELVEVSPSSTVAEIVEEAGKRLPEAFRKFVFNDQGELETTLLLALDGEQVSDASVAIGNSAAELMLLPPIAGG